MEQDLKRILLTEYRLVTSRIVEAQRDLKDLSPRQEVLAKTLEAYGWLGEIEKLEPDDDLKNNPDGAKSKGQKVVEIVKEHFESNNNQWTRISDLYVLVTEKGLWIGGKNPSSTLSAHLSNSECLESDRTKGWRLKPETLKQQPAMRSLAELGRSFEKVSS